MIERKITYDGRVVEYPCQLIEKKENEMILFHRIEEPFTMHTSTRTMTIEPGDYTTAHYWTDRPYNVYIWKDAHDTFKGAYFNIVKKTLFTKRAVTFYDLIIDILVFPDGEVAILDRDELPTDCEHFEDGFVQEAVHRLLKEYKEVLKRMIE